MNRKPAIVAIIGSTRFKNQQLGYAQKLTLEGKLVLLSGFWHHSDPYPITNAQKDMIDELLIQRINASNEVLVVCPNGYVGTSTQRGIDYAKAAGKPVAYTETPVLFEPARP